MPSHSASTLAEFTGSGDPRLVFARSTTDDSVTFMPDGHAEQFRDRTKAGELVCVVPDCSSPRLKVMNRGARRDGFAHFRRIEQHSAMGVHHLQSQLTLARWLREKYPDATVELEATTEDGRRRADVMFISVSGRRAAFEVQYAALTPRAWEERHASYQEQGVVDIWLWGHVTPHLRKVRGEVDRSELTPVMHSVARAGQPILWINPESEEIGVGTSSRFSHYAGEYESLAPVETARFQAFPLDAFRLTAEHGFTCDHIQEVRKAEDAAHRLIEIGRRKEEAEDAAEERRRANMEAYFERLRTKASARYAEWVHTADYAQLVKEFGSKWPDFLDVIVTGLGERQHVQLVLPFENQQWQGDLYLRFIRGRPQGSQVTLAACTKALEEWDTDVRFPGEAVYSWFRALVQCGVLRRTPFLKYDGMTGSMYVVGRLDRVVANYRGPSH